MMTKILIVEDDEKIVCALTMRMKSLGYDVISAFDPIRGMSYVVKENPDLVILDLSMPAGGGLALAKRMRQNAKYVAIPIIVITASKQDEPRQKAKEFGIEYYLEKPFDHAELAEAVKNSLQFQN